MLNNASALRAERQDIWTRPIEVSYALGQEVSGESSTSTVLGVLRMAGDPVKQAPSINILGGAAVGLSSNAKYAIGALVEANGADGFYVIYVEDTNSGLFIRSSQSSVRGYLLDLNSLGEVSMERADLDRFGHAPAE